MLNLLKKAEVHCEQNQLRLTGPRKHVLRIVMEAGRPLGAYDILKQLALCIEEPKPPTVYRALQFWCEEGFIHALDSLKAYIACSHGHHIGEAQFFICNTCGDVSEEHSLIDKAALKASIIKHQFKIKTCTTEIKGQCVNCNKIS